MIEPNQLRKDIENGKLTSLDLTDKKVLEYKMDSNLTPSVKTWLTYPEGIDAASLLTDGTLLTIGKNLEFKFWDINTGENVDRALNSDWTAHIGGIGAASFLSDGTLLSVGKETLEFKFWNINAGKSIDRALDSSEFNLLTDLINRVDASVSTKLLKNGHVVIYNEDWLRIIFLSEKGEVKQFFDFGSDAKKENFSINRSEVYELDLNRIAVFEVMNGIESLKRFRVRIIDIESETIKTINSWYSGSYSYSGHRAWKLSDGRFFVHQESYVNGCYKNWLFLLNTTGQLIFINDKFSSRALSISQAVATVDGNIAIVFNEIKGITTNGNRAIYHFNKDGEKISQAFKIENTSTELYYSLNKKTAKSSKSSIILNEDLIINVEKEKIETRIIKNNKTIQTIDGKLLGVLADKKLIIEEQNTPNQICIYNPINGEKKVFQNASQPKDKRVTYNEGIILADNYLVTTDSDQSTKIWDIKVQKYVKTLFSITGKLALLSSTQFAVLGDNGIITICSFTQSRPIQTNDIYPLLEALKHNHSVTECRLQGVALGNKGVAVVADILKHNQTITSLDLGETGITKEGAKKLLTALKDNHHIISLNLEGNAIPKETLDQIYFYLARNNKMDTADVPLSPKEPEFNLVTEAQLQDVIKQTQLWQQQFNSEQKKFEESIAHQHNQLIAQLTQHIQTIAEKNIELENKNQDLQQQLEKQQKQFELFSNKQFEQMQHLNQRLDKLQGNVKSEQQFLDEMLLNAAKQGQFDKLQHALKIGANGLITDEQGLTSLHWAALNGQTEVINQLVSKYPQLLIAQDDDGQTALHKAAAANQLEMVKLLLDRGADDNLLDQNKQTSFDIATPEAKQLIVNKRLWKAAKEDNLLKVKEALDKGADINAKAEDGETALHKAVHHQYATLVEFLTQQGADITVQNKYAQTPMEYAKTAQYKEIRLILANQLLINAVRQADEKALLEALNQDADVRTAKNREGEMPLHIAAQQGQFHLITLLLEKGAEIAAADAKGQIALHHAVKGGNKDVIKFILKRHAQASLPIDIQDQDGKIPTDLCDKKLSTYILQKFGAYKKEQKILAKQQSQQQPSSQQSGLGNNTIFHMSNSPYSAIANFSANNNNAAPEEVISSSPGMKNP